MGVLQNNQKQIQKKVQEMHIDVDVTYSRIPLKQPTKPKKEKTKTKQPGSHNICTRDFPGRKKIA